ncbi:TPA: dinitrogenase iron-molybdenum cofactor biosynthesis protein [Thermoplasmata archaeon]|nr:dinitrogenase iron-molybdenum cofactor biosynthesis protein [Thermoplasmata archaeon]
MRGYEEREDGRLVAITSTGHGYDSAMDSRFGRCAFFAMIGSDGVIEAVPNAARGLGNGAGIQAAKQIVDLGADTVITGDVGPNAFRVLAAAGVRVFVGANGTVGEVLDGYRKGELREAAASTAPGHHGMRGGRWGNRQ